MPKEFRLAELPAGITVSSALPGETIPISVKAFFSSEDGNAFVEALEAVMGIFGCLFGPTRLVPSQVDHFLALVAPDRRVRAYCNELPIKLRMQSKRKLAAGEPVLKSDIADYDTLDTGVVVPPDYGVVFLLSSGWRKGIYYDFGPLDPEKPKRTEDLARLFASFWARLTFQSRYSITEKQWERLTEIGWFPFIWLDDDALRKLLAFLDRPEYPQSILDATCRKFADTLESRAGTWKAHSLIRKHSAFLDAAVKSYQEGRYIDCISVLYPRIEGIIGEACMTGGKWPRQKEMVERLAAHRECNSLLLPRHFTEYLHKFYFNKFDLEKGLISLSRQTVAHGTSKAEDYSFIFASLSLMILDQLFYYIKPPEQQDSKQ